MKTVAEKILRLNTIGWHVSFIPERDGLRRGMRLFAHKPEGEPFRGREQIWVIRDMGLNQFTPAGIDSCMSTLLDQCLADVDPMLDEDGSMCKAAPSGIESAS